MLMRKVFLASVAALLLAPAGCYMEYYAADRVIPAPTSQKLCAYLP